MVKGAKVLSTIAVAITIVAIVHSFSHLYIYGSKSISLIDASISGFSIGPLEVSETSTKEFLPLSQMILIAEWTLVILTLLLTIVKKNIDTRKEISSIDLSKYHKDSKTKTDLDVLHALLKDKK